MNEGHGHVYPRQDGVKARCGGPGICKECSTDLAQKLATAGLRTPRKQRIQDEFQKFANMVFPDAEPERLEHLRRTFFAGASIVFGLIVNSLGHETPEATEADLSFMDDLHHEIEQWGASLGPAAFEVIAEHDKTKTKGKPLYEDLFTLSEEERIGKIGQAVMTGKVVGVTLEMDEPKIARYLAQLMKRLPEATLLSRHDNVPIKGVVTIRIGRRKLG